MALKVLLYLDYDKQTGMGHITRSKGFIEALSVHATEIYICCKLNPKIHEPQLEFLNHFNWVTLEEAKLQCFSLIYVDTYDYEFLDEFQNWPANHKVVLVDSNYFFEIPSWADFVIDVERTSARNSSFKGEYLFGDIVSNSDLEFSRNAIRDKLDKKIERKNLAVAVNFGGSLNIRSYIQQLEKTLLAHKEISFSIYCPLSLSQEMNLFFLGLQNVEVKVFTSDYLRELSVYDFLITGSGTSFIEGLFLHIPLVVFNFFPNANINFDRFRNNRLVLFSGTGHEVETSWMRNVLKEFNSEKILERRKSDFQLGLIIISQFDLNSRLVRMLG